jgi:3-dehydroquinate synthase
MHTVRVNLGPRSYDIALTSGDPKGVGPFAKAAAPRATTVLIVTDSNLQLGHAAQVSLALWSSGLRVGMAVVPAGEPSKSLERAAELYDHLADLPADRNTLVAAVGGGVVGDLAGFAAATYNRGLPLLMVPTSLLAMVDSSVGGKTGINHPQGKNLIGAFHQPAGVWIDTAFLTALPDREFRSGLAEVVKYGVILDAEFFDYLEANAAGILARQADRLEHVVGRSCRLKADIVEQDEREETGLRAALNYGHTFAHAFETVGGYGRWLHGEAVAAGMVCASRLAEKLDLIPKDTTDRQVNLLRVFGLPTAPDPNWPADDLIAVMRRDKKAQGGQLRFVLPTRLGRAETFGNVSEALVREVLRP